jgi:hypothetical protein
MEPITPGERRSLVRTRLGTATCAAVLGATVLSLSVSGADQAQTAAPYTPPRTADGRPDLGGIWQSLNTAVWNIQDHSASLGVPAGQGIVEGNEIPYQPSALAQRQENHKNRLTADPEAMCRMVGVPRIMYMPYPLQIVQSTNKIQMAFAFATTARTIHLDEVEGPPDLTYMGHSVARWDGDTLVVDVTDFNGKNWFDRAGNYHSEALHLTERFTPISKDAIQYEVTIEDPNVFTRPWKISMPLYRRLEPNAQLLEYRCTEFAEEFMYGGLRKQPLVHHWEGETLIVDIKRKVAEVDKLHDWYRR